jgi:precorrin-4 methylase
MHTFSIDIIAAEIKMLETAAVDETFANGVHSLRASIIAIIIEVSEVDQTSEMSSNNLAITRPNVHIPQNKSRQLRRQLKANWIKSSGNHHSF